MNPTGVLAGEHRVIERLLDALERAAARLAAGEAVPAGTFVDLAAMARGYADECHHAKEEGLLFPALEAAGFPGESGPIGMLRAEHVEGRRLVGELRAAAQRLGGGDAAAASALRSVAAEYVDLLRAHIQKEDQVLFPWADEVLNAGEQARLAQAFALQGEVEEARGVAARCVALLDRLEGGPPAGGAA